MPRCDTHDLWRSHPLRHRITLDYHLHLFENMYKAGGHRVEGGALHHASPPSKPLVVHFNGPAKVTFEGEWRVPWDATAGLTPVRHLTNALCGTLSRSRRAEARSSFEDRVTFLSPTLARLHMGPFNLTCDELTG